MKKLFFTIALSLLAVGAFAQKKVLKDAEKALKKGELETAIELATQASNDPETGAEVDVYIVLGKAYLQKFVDSGKQDVDAARTSLDWFLKAKGMGDDKVVETLMEQPYFNPADNSQWIGGGETIGLLDYYFITEGNSALEAEDYERAYEMLALSAEIEGNVAKDFFAGYAADNADKKNEAYKYFLKVLDYDEEYENVNFAYSSVIQYEVEAKDFENALKHIREGQKQFPDDKLYKNWEVDVLIQSERMDEAIAGLTEIIKNGSPDKTTYYTLAYLQWNNNQLVEAEINAKKALEMDANYNEALYVAGSVIFNQAADIMKEANLTTEEAKYNALKEKAMDRFKEALPMFEKQLEKDPNDVYSLRPLSTIYDQLGMDAKRDAILDRLDKIDNK